MTIEIRGKKEKERKKDDKIILIKILNELKLSFVSEFVH